MLTPVKWQQCRSHTLAVHVPHCHHHHHDDSQIMMWGRRGYRMVPLNTHGTYFFLEFYLRIWRWKSFIIKLGFIMQQNANLVCI